MCVLMEAIQILCRCIFFERASANMRVCVFVCVCLQCVGVFTVCSFVHACMCDVFVRVFYVCAYLKGAHQNKQVQAQSSTQSK